MKKLLIILFVGAILMAWGAIQIDSADASFAGRLRNPLGYETFDDLVNAIINFIFRIALVTAPLFIIIGGFYFVTAAGDPQKIETGKKIILYTLIGFFIIFISRALIGEITELIRSGADQRGNGIEMFNI